MGRPDFHLDSAWSAWRTEQLRLAGLWPQGKLARDNLAIQFKGIDVVGDPSYEIKIVRWKGRHYTAMTLEELSNVETGRPGWMFTSTADVLDYLMETQTRSMRQQRFIFPPLRRWWTDHYKEFPISDTNNPPTLDRPVGFTTRCRVVSLDAIPDECWLLRDHMVVLEEDPTP